jgi:hypothetical protein
MLFRVSGQDRVSKAIDPSADRCAFRNFRSSTRGDGVGIVMTEHTGNRVLLNPTFSNLGYVGRAVAQIVLKERKCWRQRHGIELGYPPNV